MESIGERLNQLRKEKRLSQESLATQLNVTRQAISNWERGKTEPDLQMLAQLADLLGTDVDYLLGRTSQSHQGEVTYSFKPLRTIYQISWLVVIGFCLFISISPNYSWAPELIILFVLLLIETSIYFFFGYAIKTGDYTMLAGYDKRVDYHYPTLKKMVYIMAFNWLLTTVMFIGIYLFLILLKFSLDGLALGFILLYVGEVISFTLVTNWKYRDQLLLSQKDQDEAKIGVWISIGFFVLILLLVITMASTMMLFNIENNSLEVARLLVFFFPYVILSLISLFFEQSRVKKAVQKGEKYKIDSLTYLMIVGCLCLLVGLVWTGASFR